MGAGGRRRVGVVGVVAGRGGGAELADELDECDDGADDEGDPPVEAGAIWRPAILYVEDVQQDGDILNMMVNQFLFIAYSYPLSARVTIIAF